MENALKLIMLSISLILTGVVIFFAVNLTNTGSLIAKSLTTDINDKNASVENAQYEQYANSVCSGSMVVSAIRKYKNDLILSVTVFTNETTTTEITSFDSFQNYPSNSNYINPSAEFDCELIISANGVVSGMKFKQRAYVSTYVSTSANASSTQSNLVSGTTGEVSVSTSPFILEGNYAVDDDVEIVFSEGSESSSFVTGIANDLASISSRIDENLLILKNFDFDTNSAAELENVHNSMLSLETTLCSVKEKCKDERVGKSEATEYLTNIQKMQSAIKNATAAIEELQSQLQEVQNTENVWWIGYPIQEDVKVELRDGVLEFSGIGEVSLNEELPEWLCRAGEIESVVFQEGLVIENVDFWFTGCTKLREISLPDSVVSANGTFEGCTKLKQVYLGNWIRSANGIGGAKAVFYVPESSVTAKTFESLQKLMSLNVEVV